MAFQLLIALGVIVIVGLAAIGLYTLIFPDFTGVRVYADDHVNWHLNINIGDPEDIGDIFDDPPPVMGSGDSGIAINCDPGEPLSAYAFYQGGNWGQGELTVELWVHGELQERSSAAYYGAGVEGRC